MNKTGLLPQSDNNSLVTCNACYHLGKRKTSMVDDLTFNAIREALGKIKGGPGF